MIDYEDKANYFIGLMALQPFRAIKLIIGFEVLPEHKIKYYSNKGFFFFFLIIK